MLEAKSAEPKARTQMSEEEIVRNYKGAKNKSAQIKILADLNYTTKDEIKEILTRNGVKEEELPAKPGRKKRDETKDIPEVVREACGKEMVNLQMDIDKNEDTIRDLQKQNQEKEAKMIQLREFCA